VHGGERNRHRQARTGKQEQGTNNSRMPRERCCVAAGLKEVAYVVHKFLINYFSEYSQQNSTATRNPPSKQNTGHLGDRGVHGPWEERDHQVGCPHQLLELWCGRRVGCVYGNGLGVWQPFDQDFSFGDGPGGDRDDKASLGHVLHTRSSDQTSAKHQDPFGDRFLHGGVRACACVCVCGGGGGGKRERGRFDEGARYTNKALEPSTIELVLGVAGLR
jgi:hypothetical protein